MGVTSQAFAQEFLEMDWYSYAIAELSRDGKRLDDSAAGIERLDRLTRILVSAYASSRSALEKAINLLDNWLEQFPDHGSAPTFRLRLALYLWKSKQYEVALRELDRVVATEPNSAALHAFQGVLYNRLGETQKSLTCFEEASKHDIRWSEPHLERIEKAIMLGQYRKAVEAIKNRLGNPANTSREMIVLMAYKSVALVLETPAYLESTEHKATNLDIIKLDHDPKTSEEWYVKDVWKHVRELPPLKPPQEVRDELFKFLMEVDKKLRGEPAEKEPLEK